MLKFQSGVCWVWLGVNQERVNTDLRNVFSSKCSKTLKYFVSGDCGGSVIKGFPEQVMQTSIKIHLGMGWNDGLEPAWVPGDLFCLSPTHYETKGPMNPSQRNLSPPALCWPGTPEVEREGEGPLFQVALESHALGEPFPHSCSFPRQQTQDTPNPSATPTAAHLQGLQDFTAPEHPHWPLGDSALFPKRKSDTNPTVLISHPSNPRAVSGVLPGRVWLIAKELWVLWSWLWRRLQGWTCKRSLSCRFRYPAKFAAKFCSSLWERCFMKNAEKSYHAIPL